ncbi:MAG: DUF1134 domain-containing protein [Pseudomonadota bacterium]
MTSISNAGLSRRRSAVSTLVATAFIAALSLGTVAEAEQLPWGAATQEPDVVTPSTTYDPGPIDPADDYDTRSGSYEDDSLAPRRTRRGTPGTQDRFQDDPDYSTYQPAAPDPNFDVDDGLYDPQRQRRARRKPGQQGTGERAYVPRTAPPQQAETPYPSRFDGTFSADEIVRAGHNAFGQVARGFASVVEYAFQKQGRPNGYIIGQEAGGAVVAGLRYGEGMLYTKNAGNHAVYWQGPSVGYDFGAEGSKTMILVYDMRDTSDVYGRFGGVDGSAYLVGGVGITFQQRGHVIMAPIRSGVGLRLGANIGYLKYSRVPTWNPF